MKSPGLLDAEEEIERLEGLVELSRCEINRLKQEHNFMRTHLKLWKEEVKDGPINELASIQAWLLTLSKNGAEETANIMRTRMLLLMGAAEVLYHEGPAAEDKAGIYENRPDLRP